MTMKKRHTLRKLDEKEAPFANDNWDVLYSAKLESLKKYMGSASAIQNFAFQEVTHGELFFSATGSATVAKTVPIGPFQDVVFAQAHAVSTLALAMVTDVTATSITVTVRSVSGTAAFSAVTTGTITAYFQVIGSSP